MDNTDHLAYELLSKTFSDIQYVQHEYWGIHRDFKLDPILSASEFIESGVPNQVRTGDKGTTIPSVAATL